MRGVVAMFHVGASEFAHMDRDLELTWGFIVAASTDSIHILAGPLPKALWRKAVHFQDDAFFVVHVNRVHPASPAIFDGPDLQVAHSRRAWRVDIALC